ncbi:porin family protein [Spirulina subsalsa FACHB-351]|uniref:Porin family protein n=1 Tax=Spirulina subsalsa FACHB-351 TaxID=234711 RepID=A0ABT3L559_9CYAN|nr:porin family protein [Spirulina subsalsa]MCW6036327.1 porin family protein [Spirulina subsalsa FACHB-351]
MNRNLNRSAYALLGLTPFLWTLGELPSWGTTQPETPLSLPDFPSLPSENPLPTASVTLPTPVAQWIKTDVDIPPSALEVESRDALPPSVAQLPETLPPENLPPNLLEKKAETGLELDSPTLDETLPTAPEVAEKIQKTISLSHPLEESLDELETEATVEEVQTDFEPLDELETVTELTDSNGVHTSAALLQPTTPEQVRTPSPADSSPESQEIAQRMILPGRGVNTTWNYVAGGVNVGLGGGTDLGTSSFAVYSKIALPGTLSVRPGVLLGDSATLLLPVTYDLRIPSPDPFLPSTIFPYFGGGLAYTTRNAEGNSIGPLLSGGVDVRLTDKLVVNGGINVGYLEKQVQVGLILGIGYIFLD